MECMFKVVKDHVWAFDAEWVPDPETGRRLYGLPPDMDDGDVMLEMWRLNGATDEDPQPFLKLVLSRVISIAVVLRRQLPGGGVQLQLRSRPEKPFGATECDEATILKRFLTSVGKIRPQLVGYNSSGSDLPVFVQRGIVKGIVSAGFCRRPERPWEGADYFAPRGSDWNIDLMKAVGTFGKARPSLHELAVASGIPGKMEDFDGGSIAEAWLGGEIERIVRYNEQDALTTYLVWLRTAHFAGHVDDEQYEAEQQQLRDLLEAKAQSSQYEHLGSYLEEWNRLSGTEGSS